jgi:anti-sigma B factor antagonist
LGLPTRISGIEWLAYWDRDPVFSGAAWEKVVMASQAFSVAGLKLELEEKPEETIVHCIGRITAETAEFFQNQIRDNVMPVSRGRGIAVTSRVAIDLSEVSFVDSTGLGALLAVWTAGQRRSIDVELVNLNPRVDKLVSLTKLDQVFSKMKNLFGS